MEGETCNLTERSLVKHGALAIWKTADGNYRITARHPRSTIVCFHIALSIFVLRKS